MWKCLGVNTSFEIKGMPLVSQKNLLIKTILSLKVHLGTYYAPQFQKKSALLTAPDTQESAVWLIQFAVGIHN